MGGGGIGIEQPDEPPCGIDLGVGRNLLVAHQSTFTMLP